MTQDDLRQARIHLWHQDGQPVLTTEDATAWLDDIGFARLLPDAHALASLAQAMAGSAEKEVASETQEQARTLAAQLMQARSAVPLLWDEASALSGEQFDALASAELLPHIYCLRGDRDWKKPPQGSPLMQAVWQELQSGPKTVAEIVTGVGREITEAAILRALRELWAKLRAMPMLETPPSDTGTKWELPHKLWPEQMKRGATMSHPLALSAMISVYLHAAVAATADEVDDALSPLAARSRIREVLHALQATRQLKMFPVGRSSAFALSGGSAEVLDEVAAQRDSNSLKASRAEAAARQPSGRSPREFGERKAWARDKKAVSKTPAGRKTVSRGAGGGEAVGEPAAGEAAPFVKRAAQSNTGEARGGSGFVRKEWKPRPAGQVGRERPAGERKEWKPRAAAGFAGKPSGPKKPWQKREGGDARASRPRPFDKPRAGAAAPGERREWKARPERSSGVRPAGERKEWKPRATTGFAGKSSGPRKPWQKRDGADRPARPASERREWKDRPVKSSSDGPAGERKEWKPRSPAGSKPFGGPKKFGAKKFGGPTKFGPKKFDSTAAEARGPSRFRAQDDGSISRTKKPFNDSKKFGGPKKFGAKSFSGERKFAGAPKKFSAGKKFSPRPGGAKNFSRDRKPEGKKDEQP